MCKIQKINLIKPLYLGISDNNIFLAKLGKNNNISSLKITQV